MLNNAGVAPTNAAASQVAPPGKRPVRAFSTSGALSGVQAAVVFQQTVRQFFQRGRSDGLCGFALGHEVAAGRQWGLLNPWQLI